jgi:hypothetical protein
MIDGRRIWLVSGSIHYFRVPRPLWADRLLQAKRAGLNCITTYVAWNVHEPHEGQWERNGDQDVTEFVRLAGDLGLYVILRPGPYICAEWDLGGLPGWLAGKSGVSYRTNNAAYMHYFDKYFAQMLPALAEMQAPNGGNIILIQNENEYPYTTQPDRTAYLDFISQLMSEPFLGNAVECVNGWGNLVPQLKKLRMKQPDAPLLVTEFRDGWFDRWGREHQTRDAWEVARKALEILGCGSQYNYYMWHGGTNFGFYGGRQTDAPDSWQTTSYDYDAPLAEGGGRTEKYYATRLVNLLANHMGPYLAGARLEEAGVGICDASDAMNITGPNSHWAIVTNNGRKDIDRVEIALPCGRKLTVHLEPIGATAVPFDLLLGGGAVLDYCSLMPLGIFGDEGRRVLLVHGPAKADGILSLNGKPIPLSVPAENEGPGVVELEGLTVLVLTSNLAMHTWPLDDSILFGPRFVNEDDEPQHAPGAKQYHEWTLADGKLHPRKIKPQALKPPPAPRLGAWKRTCICPEPVSDDLKWQKMDRPRDVDKLGHHYGYVWYRIEIEQDRPRKRRLFLPECSDRASLYLNGTLLGVWGLGEGAARTPIDADFKKGKNILVVLVDNLGRYNFGYRLDERKGLYGHVYDAKRLRTNKFKIKPADGFPKRIVPRNLTHLMGDLESLPIVSAELSIPLTKVSPIHLSFTNLPHHVALFCNDRPVGFFPALDGCPNYGDVTLGAELKKGKNLLQVLLWGEVDPQTLDNVIFHTLLDPISAGATWGARPWTQPDESAREPVKGKGCWFASRFKYQPAPQPLFVTLHGAKKGQLFLNKRNVGRFWDIGPQEWYYLPECWLKDENELLVFEEHGHMPVRCKLEFRPLGPFQK